MGQFDTHGGYFSPKDYIRINEGGSHEENPYGGVQLGVDPEGVPNMVEEGESVYKDFVFSDNIVADKTFLEENHLPVKYAGKLYSDIADKFVDEAEERPNDPISNSGLNAMLLRLAECQEAQKQAQEQKELEEELAQLSPEELDELEMMLAQQEQAPVEEVPQEEMMGPAEPMPEEVVPEVPMMRNGGPMNRFYPGGQMDDDEDIDKLLERARSQRSSNAEREQKYKDALSRENSAALKYGWRNFLNNIFYFGNRGYEREKAALETMLQDYASGSEHPMEGAVNQERLIRNQYDYVNELAEKKRKREEKLDKAKKELDAARNEVWKYHPGTVQVDIPEEYQIDTTGMTFQNDTDDVQLNFDSAPGKPFIIPAGGRSRALANGGRINRFDYGGDDYRNFMNLLTNYGVSRNRGGVEGYYKIDNNFTPYLWGNNDIGALEHDPRYIAFTNLVKKKAAEGNRRALMYLSKLDERVADWTDRLFDKNGNLRKGWESIYDDRRGDGDAGIYHLIPQFADVKDIESFFDEPTAVGGVANPRYSGQSGIIGRNIPSQTSAEWLGPEIFPGQYSAYYLLRNAPNGDNGASPADADDNGSVTSRYTPLPTAGRYAKALGATALGLYDLAQQPYKYQFPEIIPQAPYGTVNYQPLVYNPMDWMIPYNALNAQTNASLRALKGNPITLGANVIGLDNVGTQSQGNTMNQTWSANNTHRNEVIAGNNQTEGQRAAFDYGVSKDRAGFFNDAARMNFQKELYRQRLNNEEETAKYAALSNQINTGLDALTGIGTENFRMNQANTNTALMGYQVVPDGRGGYKLVSTAKCGGLLKNPKK